MEFYTKDDKSAYDAQRSAYWISFAPIIFQASRTLMNTNILQYIKETKDTGITLAELVEKTGLTTYQVRVLVHAGLGIGLVYLNEDKFCLTKTGFFLLHDKPVKVNMDFTNDVCYQGLFYLEDSIKKGKPEGLKVFGEWNTIYEALSQLPPKVQESWFGLDHYYSDDSFPKAIDILLKYKPEKIMDIGGNTGKFAKLILQKNTSTQVTLVDLPGQLNMAEKNLSPIDLNHQINYFPTNLLDENQSLPKNHDMIWMSQFLDCFSEKEIISILKRCAAAIDADGKICIQEGFWDKQKIETSAFCLQQFSLYFTSMANGNSQMYDYKTFAACIEAAGLQIVDEYHNIGISNSLLICQHPKK